MLTGDLVRVRVKGAELHPSYIDATSAGLLQTAAELTETLQRALEDGWCRAEVDEAINGLVGDRRDAKLVRGLAKLSLDRATFDVDTPVPPPELRDRVFRKARAAGPLALEPGPLGRPTADAVIEAVATELGLTADQIRIGLYADLKEAQRLSAFDALAPEALLHRYNVALVQACLYRAVEVRVRLHRPTPVRVRQLLRWAKFHQLVHHAERDGDDLVLVLDGPTSLFSQSTRYGGQLANFFPAVLLQEGTWWLEATVLWTKARYRKTLRVGHDAGLVSHHPDTGAYQTRAHAWFEERWAAHDSPWRLSADTTPIDLGGRAVVMPDYRFEHPDGRVGRLELIGFWTRERLARHLELLERYGPGDLLVAVSRRLRAEKAVGALPPHVLEYAEVLAPARVVAALEATAR